MTVDLYHEIIPRKDCYNEANTSLKKCLRDCNCPDGAELVDGICRCDDDLILTPAGDLCYDGIDSFFDDTKYKCDNNDLDTLLQDIDYHWGLEHPERLSVNCSAFGYPVIQVDIIGEFEQGPEDSGISPALQPTTWSENYEFLPIMSATIRYEVFYPFDHEFIENEYLPSFYHNGPSNGYRLTRLKMKNQILQMDTNHCDFCDEINAKGTLGKGSIFRRLK